MTLIFVKIFIKMTELRQIIETAWDNRELLKETATQDAIRNVISLLDSGKLRVAEPTTDGMGKKSSSTLFPYPKNGDS